MKYQFRYGFSFIAVFVLLVCRVTVSEDVAENANKITIEKRIDSVLRADFAGDVAKRFGELFEAVDANGLSELMQSPHDSIALQAAWEEVAMTVPEKINDDHPTFHPDAGKLNWFVGFLEGRLRIRVPRWWRNAVLDARANNRRNIYFPYQNWGMKVRKRTNRISFTKADDVISVKVGKDSVQLPKEFLEALSEDHRFSKYRETIEEAANGDPPDGCSVHFTPKRCYLALHEDICVHYLLVCIDRENGSTLWKTKGIGCFWAGLGGGVGRPRVTVDVQNNQVLFFECSGIGEIYVEAFRAEDGKQLYRFSPTFNQSR